MIIISDFQRYSPEVIKNITVTSQHNDVILFKVFDPMEREIPTTKIVAGDASRQVVVDGTKKSIKEKFPALAEAASLIGTDKVRNTATVGGNLCTGASCCDMAPVLIESNASAELVSTNGKRSVAITDFFVSTKEPSDGKGE